MGTATKEIAVMNAPATLPNVQPPSEAVIRSLSDDDQVLLTKILTEPAEFVDHPDFHKPGSEQRLFGGPAKFFDRTSTRFVEYEDEIVDSLKTGERVPALPQQAEQHLFMRFNYARMKLTEILLDNAGQTLSRSALRLALAWGRRVISARGAIVRQNMPLVLAMAKRTRLANIDFNELVSEGNMALLRSVEKFDCSRGFKFSTYSCRAILKSFSRVAIRASRYRGTFPTEFDPAMERSDFVDRRRDDVEVDCVDELKEILISNLAGLSEVERTVIDERFAIGRADNGLSRTPKTLEQVGNIIGVTKERVRQIQNNALKKIRHALEDRYLAA
ncbi:MAG: sigma-70 family RNA polymerase sigma factor [Phycisphaerae bacterium]|nr:sigma-70 family RNA polymerase sigma factor [Phycisphaerae bacterium]